MEVNFYKSPISDYINHEFDIVKFEIETAFGTETGYIDLSLFEGDSDE